MSPRTVGVLCSLVATLLLVALLWGLWLGAEWLYPMVENPAWRIGVILLGILFAAVHFLVWGVLLNGFAYAIVHNRAPFAGRRP